MATVDVVVVSYNSREHLRRCVAPLHELPDVNVIVVDNASSDGTLETVADLPLTIVARPSNGGFAVGCNEGVRAGAAPYILFLNPDATIQPASLTRLLDVLRSDRATGAVVPRIEHPDGTLAFSLRRFPRWTSSLGEALFLHRLFPNAGWATEIVRDPAAYEREWAPEWASGACLLVSRQVLEHLGGFDEGFFLFGEDVDLCARLRAAGLRLRFVPDARVSHFEGASAPNTVTLPLLAGARIRYAQKHRGPVGRAVDRGAVALNALTHLALGRGGLPARRGHLRALQIAFGDRGR